MQNNSKYTSLALQILNTNNLDLYNQLAKCIIDPTQIDQILIECYSSQEMLFVVSNILIKKILSHDFVNLEDEINLQENITYQNKKTSLIKVITKLWHFANQLNMAKHVINTVINAISVGLKCLSQLPKSKEQFRDCLKFLCQNFQPSQMFCTPVDTELPEIINTTQLVENLPKNYTLSIQIFTSMFEYITNPIYFNSYYLFRRHIYDFRTNFLSFIFNYTIRIMKVAFNSYNRAVNKRECWASMHPIIKLLQTIVMYPYTLRIHQSQHQQQISDNIAGLQTQIYFPSFFRGYLCDTGLLYDLANYLITLMKQSNSIDQVRQQLNLLIRIIGRTISTADYIFGTQDQRINFRQVSIQMLINIIMQQKYFDQYYFQCLTKIFIKIIVVYTDKDYGQNRTFFYESILNFMKNAMVNSKFCIEDGQKTQIRLIFDVTVAMINGNEDLKPAVQQQSQQILKLFFQKLSNNHQNSRMIEQFGQNNPQETECFQEIFMKVSEIFKIQFKQNLGYFRQIDVASLNKQSMTFWLHLCAIILPQNDTSEQQTQLILKFFHVAVSTRTIASLHYINTLLTQILTDVEDGVSTTYLWKFMEQSLKMNFQSFLTEIINYTVNILTIPNYTLIQNGLQLFKNLFTKLCKIKHKSYNKYFQMVQKVSTEIDQTMLVHPDYVKLRIDFFSVISMVWISQNQLVFVYKILQNIRNSLGSNNDLLHFMRYLIDVTGILDPVESHEIFKVLVQLILTDLNYLLPYFMGDQHKIKVAFGQQQFLRAFMRFLLQLVNDYAYRLTYETHSDLGIRIQETFRPYIIAALEFDFPKKTVEIIQKFIKLNPLSDLLPFKKQFKQKNSALYRVILREYFQNLFRLKTQDQFYYMYGFIQDSVQLMSDWWQQVIIRDMKPNIDIISVVNARIWNTNRQKQNFAKMLYKISRYDNRYYQITGFTSQSAFSKWFVENYQ